MAFIKKRARLTQQTHIGDHKRTTANGLHYEEDDDDDDDEDNDDEGDGDGDHIF